MMNAIPAMNGMMLALAGGATWLLIGAVLTYQRLKFPPTERHRALLETIARESELLPRWVIPVIFAAVLPVVPLLRAHSWLTKNSGGRL